MTYYPINEDTAKRANDANSFRDYKPGSATAAYRAEVDKAAALAEKQKAKVDPMHHDKLDGLLEAIMVTKKPPAYLREARVKAGYVSRGTASIAVPYSPETIGRHERGEVDLTPADAVVYAESYKSPDILLRYCATCPVGCKMGWTAADIPLPHATLRIRRLIVDAQAVADRLEEIAFDGVIDESERRDFEEALRFLRQLEASINDIILIGLGKREGTSRQMPEREVPDN